MTSIEIIEHGAQPADAIVHGAERLHLRLRHFAELFVGHHAQVPDDRRQRRRQLVADVSVELRAQPIHVAQALVRGRELRHLLFEVRDDALALHAQALARGVGAGDHRFAVPAKVLTHLTGEIPRIERLLNEAVAPDGEARLAVPFRRDGDDGDPFQCGLASKAKCHLVPVETGDVQVDED